MGAADIDGYDRARSAYWTVAAALIAAATAAFGDHRIVTLSPVWPVLAAAVCAVVAVVVGVQRAARAAGVFRAVAWLASGGWVGWCYVYGPWHATTWEALVAGTLVLAVVSLALPMPDGPNPQPTGGHQPPAAAQDADAVTWGERLANVAKAPGTVVTSVDPWPVGAGYTVRGELPVSTSPKDEQRTWADIAGRSDKLYASLRLPAGAGVEVGPGDHSLGFRIDVATRDTLGEPWEYGDTTPLSINAPIPLGLQRDTAAVAPVMRSRCSLVLAAPDKGKTNYLHDLTGGYVRCPDVLVWHIDLGGAGLALPWLDPWLEGRMDRPVIDWVATNIGEAQLMTEYALQVIVQRRGAYRRLMAEQNTDIIPCSPAVPAIRIVSDETAEATGTSGDPTLRRNIIRIIQLGRAAGVRVDVSVLRATETIIPMDALRLIDMRVAFGVTDRSEFAYAMGWTAQFDPSEAPHQGMGWWRPDAATGLRVFRTPHTARPRTIDRIARACEHLRPALDEPSLNVPLRAQYLSRWDRLVPVLTGAAEPAHAAPPRPAQQGSPGTGSPGPAVGLAEGLARLDQAIERARRAGRLSSMPDDYVAAEIERLEHLEDLRAAGKDSTLLVPPAAGSDEADPRRARLLELLAGAGPEGTSGHRLAQTLADEGHGVARETVYRWLRADAVDGGRGVYIHPQFRQA